MEPFQALCPRVSTPVHALFSYFSEVITIISRSSITACYIVIYYPAINTISALNTITSLFSTSSSPFVLPVRVFFLPSPSSFLTPSSPVPPIHFFLPYLSHSSLPQVIGFDTEWKPHSGGSKPPLGLLQLSTSDCALLIRLCNLKEIPPQIRTVLENKDVLKLGVGVANDVKLLLQQFNVLCAPPSHLRPQ